MGRKKKFRKKSEVAKSEEAKVKVNTFQENSRRFRNTLWFRWKNFGGRNGNGSGRVFDSHYL